MAKVPEPMHTTAAMIYAAYEEDADDGHRPHLGASLIGGSCERSLWLTFRWAKSKKFGGRMLRLFKTGDLEEARLVADLRRIGVTVHETDANGNQWRVEALGGHFGGSMDGAGVGIPEAPKTWHVLEFKTHNDKSFKELQSKQVEKAKPQHYAQMQVYMGLTQMDRALYMAKNKNNDELYTERVDFDPVAFAKYMARAERVIKASEPPLRISQDASWFECKMCDFAELCHGQEAPEVNCRTCAHSTPELDGEARWSCAADASDPACRGDTNLSIDKQRAGCGGHRYIPILLERFATQSDYVNGDVVYQSKTGTFANGESPGSLSSLEIYAMEDKHAAGAAADIKSQIAAQGIDSKVIA